MSYPGSLRTRLASCLAETETGIFHPVPGWKRLRQSGCPVGYLADFGPCFAIKSLMTLLAPAGAAFTAGIFVLGGFGVPVDL